MPAPTDKAVELLARSVAGLCEEIHMLRDDLYNTAAINNGAAFAALSPTTGTFNFTVASMLPQAGATLHPAYANKSNGPVAVYVRSEPVLASDPPDGLLVEQTLLVLSVQQENVSTARGILKLSAGEGVTVVLRENETLYVNSMGSVAHNVSWWVIPLRGRKLIFDRE